MTSYQLKLQVAMMGSESEMSEEIEVTTGETRKGTKNIKPKKAFIYCLLLPTPLLLLLLLLLVVAFRSRGTCESVFKHACERATPFWCICAATYMFYLCC